MSERKVIKIQVEPISSENVRMPFGKYKGEKLETIPLSYLEWLQENIEDPKWEELMGHVDYCVKHGLYEDDSEEDSDNQDYWKERY